MSATHLLRVLIGEMLMSEQPVWFHRTDADLKQGDLLHKDSKSDDYDNAVEDALERYRAQNHPDKPSRLTSIFLSPSLRSHFVNFGPAFEVVPKEAGFLADSNVIDKLMKLYTETRGRRSRVMDVPDDEPLLEQYWRGVPRITKQNERRVELLVPSAKVIGPAQQQDTASTISDRTPARGDTITSDVAFETKVLVTAGEVSVGSTFKDTYEEGVPVSSMLNLLSGRVAAKIVDTPKIKKMPQSLFLVFKPGWTATVREVTVKSKYDPYALVLAVQLNDRRWISAYLSRDDAAAVLKSPTTKRL